MSKTEMGAPSLGDFVLVPREPTLEMLKAGAAGSGEDSEAVADGAYRAMLTAAPPSDALAQALATARGEDWQDIATAPRDGTRVLLWAGAWEMSWGVQAGHFEDGEWHTAEGSVVENDADFDPDAEVDFDGDEDMDWDKNSGPTHWRSLPAPPTTGQTETAPADGGRG